MIGKNKKLVVGFAGLLITALLVAILPGCPAKQEKQISWRWDIQISPTHVYTQKIYNPFIEEVNTKAGTGFKISGFPSSGTGLKPAEQLRGLKNNMVDMSEVNTGWNLGNEPKLCILAQPCLYGSQEDVSKAITALKDVLIDDLEKKWDMKVLWVSPIDEQIIWTREPITKLEDIKGMKIRCYQRFLELWVNAYGGRAVQVPYAEQYSAFERGVMDAGITGSATGVPMKFWEVTKTAYVGLGLDFIPFFIAVSGPSWRALPKKYQDILIELAQKYGPMQVQLAASIQEENYKKLEAEGMTVVRATPEEIKTARQIAKDNVWSVFAKEQGAVGQEMLDKVQKELGR